MIIVAIIAAAICVAVWWLVGQTCIVAVTVTVAIVADGIGTTAGTLLMMMMVMLGTDCRRLRVVVIGN